MTVHKLLETAPGHWNCTDGTKKRLHVGLYELLAVNMLCSKFETMGPSYGSLIWNPYLPTIYHTPIGARALKPTSRRGTTVRAHSRSPYFEYKICAPEDRYGLWKPCFVYGTCGPFAVHKGSKIRLVSKIYKKCWGGSRLRMHSS